jgi:hypothetical protein
MPPERKLHLHRRRLDPLTTTFEWRHALLRTELRRNDVYEITTMGSITTVQKIATVLQA